MFYDMVNDTDNVRRREQALLTYFQALFGRADAAGLATTMGFDLEGLRRAAMSAG